MDEKTRAALEARVREARNASSSDIPWEWDPATLEQGAKKTFLENFNVGEVRGFPNHHAPLLRLRILVPERTSYP
jgi:hypothetical protein